MTFPRRSKSRKARAIDAVTSAARTTARNAARWQVTKRLLSGARRLTPVKTVAALGAVGAGAVVVKRKASAGSDAPQTYAPPATPSVPMAAVPPAGAA